MKSWSEVRIFLGSNYNIDFIEMNTVEHIWKIENCNNGIVRVLICDSDESIDLQTIESICEQLRLFIPSDVLRSQIQD